MAVLAWAREVHLLLQTAARLLIRISGSLDAFPSHAAAILTSTVVECHRAGLAGAAYTHATRLMQPELKAAVNPAYKRKIEGLVRRRERCACAFCQSELQMPLPAGG